MAMSYFIICVFALLINKVSLQIVGVIGRSTILPCVISDNGNKLTDINVRWRHNGSLNVCVITKDKCSEEYQELDYKNRAEVFPKEFDKGNFSLKLSNLMPTDAGDYHCYIIRSSTLVKLQLLLNGSEADKGDTTTETSLMWNILIPVFIIVVFLLLVGLIVIKCKKRCYKSSGSGVSASGGHLSDNDSFQPLSN